MKNKTILLVEDNPDDELLALRALKKNNILNPVIIARDGEEALDYFFARGKFTGRNTKENPVVVLLDLKLPKIDGLEVLRQIRSHEPTRLIPIVALTSSSEETDIQSSYSLGVNSYVRKPVDFDEFTKTVEMLGSYWLQINERPN